MRCVDIDIRQVRISEKQFCSGVQHAMTMRMVSCVIILHSKVMTDRKHMSNSTGLAVPAGEPCCALALLLHSPGSPRPTTCKDTVVTSTVSSEKLEWLHERQKRSASAPQYPLGT